jgi:hypothetical protein
MLLLVTELVAIPLGSQLMERVGPNNAFAIAIPLEACSIPILFFIKETLVLKEDPPTISDNLTTHHNAPNGTNSFWQQASTKFTRGVQTTRTHMVEGVLPLLRRSALLLALAGFFFNRLSRPVLSLLIQYASVKFSLRISQVSTYPRLLCSLIIFTLY